MDGTTLKLTLEQLPDPDQQLKDNCPWVLEVQQGSGWVPMYAAKDPEEFAKSCKRFLADDKVRIKNRIGKSADYQTVAEGLGRQVVIDRLKEYEEIIQDLH